MLTGALTARGYDSDQDDCDPDINYGVELDSDCDSDIHVDIDYAYGLGEFGYVDRPTCGASSVSRKKVRDFNDGLLMT